MKVPSTLIVYYPYSIDTIYTSRFLYFGSWKTRFTATVWPVFFTLDLYTLPKVPWPISEICSISLSVRFLGVQSKVPSSLSRVSSSALLHSANFLLFFSSFLTFSYLCRLLGFFSIFFSSTTRFYIILVLTFLITGPVSVAFLLMIVFLACVLFFFLLLVEVKQSLLVLL